jgi:hypothetical protein
LRNELATLILSGRIVDHHPSGRSSSVDGAVRTSALTAESRSGASNPDDFRALDVIEIIEDPKMNSLKHPHC